MKKLFLLLGCTALLSSSCLNMNIGGMKTVVCKGPVETKVIEGLTDFSSITVIGTADLFFTQSDTYCVSVEANEEVFEHLDYKVENGTLILGAKDSANIRASKYEVTVSLPYIEAIVVAGAADVKQKGEYKADKDFTAVVNGAGDLYFYEKFVVPTLSVNVNGAGDIKVSDIEVENLSVSVNGAGDAVLAGKAKTASFSVNGAGDIDASELDYEQVTTHKAGIASIQLKKQ
jgi:hypothetical protein